MNKYLLNIAKFFLIGHLFLSSYAYANGNMGINVGLGQRIFDESSNISNGKNSNFEGSIGINPFHNIKFLDNFSFRASYGQSKLKTIDLDDYHLSLLYNFVDYSSLTLYVGYDIFNAYNMTYINSVNTDSMEISFANKKYKAISFIGGVDVRVYGSYFAFFEYRKSHIKAIDATLPKEINSYLYGIRYKFELLNLKRLKKIEE